MQEPVIDIYSDAKQLVESVARRLVQRINCKVERAGRCTLVLSGGSTPLPVYRRLAQADLAEQVRWDKVWVYFSDERAVGPDDKQSNYQMATNALLSQIPIPATNVVRIQGELPPIQAADLYHRQIVDVPLNVVLLGMGEDGHTASLFPGDNFEPSQSAAAVATVSPKIPVGRVSLSLAKINSAEEIYLLVLGKNKSEKIAKIYTQRKSAAPQSPAALVEPTSGKLTWILDEACASALMALKMGKK